MTTRDGKEYAARSGDVMIHGPNAPFSVIARTEGIHYFFNIDLHVLEDDDFFRVCLLDKVIKLRDPLLYESKFDELRSIWLQEDGEARVIQASFLVFFLLHEIIESSKIGERRLAQDPYEIDRFNKALHYMEQRLDVPITREELAHLYHMNPVYFGRAFQKIYGITPIQMHQKLRLLQAKKMLENPGNTMEHIAQKCGYYDAAHFNRAFRKVFDVSPNQYRKSIIHTKTSVVFTWQDT
ncbi:AraC family transcriptional regulator [Paenibacillus oryzisoli]|uniref:helix-turn-helix domain-containing protein n=1 Tax=Paenibacillus oryzisoli TaxID=1850517 RepID=UPI003D2C791F